MGKGAIADRLGMVFSSCAIAVSYAMHMGVLGLCLASAWLPPGFHHALGAKRAEETAQNSDS